MKVGMRAWQATLIAIMPGSDEGQGMAVIFDSDRVPTMWWVQRALRATSPDAQLLQLQKLERVPPVVVFHGDKED